MRILYFTRSDSPHDQRFLKAMVLNGYEVFALRLEPLTDPSSKIESVKEVEWKGCPKKIGLAELPGISRQVKQVIKEVRPDVIHAGPIQGPAFLAALAGAKPLLSMSWGFDILKVADKNFLTKFITRYTLKHSHMLATDCQAVTEKAQGFGFDPEKVVQFPWGVDLELFSPLGGIDKGKELRQKLGWEDAFIVLGSRAWEPMYGMDILAEAFVIAARQEPYLRLILLGQGSREGMIRSILSDGGVDDRVWFGGTIGPEDLPGIYCAADLYVSPSHVDGSSISLLEALACGRPVVVSDIPGNLEWIKPGITGTIFEDYDTQALADRLLEAKRSDQMAQLGLNARKLAEEKADWYDNFGRLSKAYLEIVQKE